ncbi:hypothetical protein D3C80_1702100 [compost metagenome]
MLVNIGIFGNGEYTARLLIEPMYRAKAEPLSAFLPIVNHPIRKRPGIMTMGGMYDNSGFFIHNQQSFIFIQNLK